MRSAAPSEVNTLVVEIQRQRVVCMLLEELESGLFNEDTYKELSMLNRMLARVDPDDPDKDSEFAAREQQSIERLQKLGIQDPASAARIARVLNSAQGRPEPKDEDERDETADDTVAGRIN